MMTYVCNTQSDTEPFHLLFMSKGQSKGNCCGGHEDTEKENSIEPLPKRPRKRSNKPLGLSTLFRLKIFCDCTV